MSRISELLALVPKAFSNPEEIAQGWIQLAKLEFGSLPEEQVIEIARRRAICSECPDMSHNAKAHGYKTKRKDSHCTLCACPIAAKTANMLSECGATYYNKTHPKLPPKEVRWGKFKEENDETNQL